MSILQMKRIRVISLSTDREALLQSLMKLGCVEISSPVSELSDPEWLSLITPDNDTASDVNARLGEINHALSTIDKYVKSPKGLFAVRRTLGSDRFFDRELTGQVYDRARAVNGLARDITSFQTELNRLSARKTSLLPWRTADIPLDTASTASVSIVFGVCPSSLPFEALVSSVGSVTDAYNLELYHTDHEQHYFLLTCLAEESGSVKTQLKTHGFTTTTFKDFTGTAAYNIRLIEDLEQETRAKIDAAKSSILSFNSDRALFENAVDMLSAELSHEYARQRLLMTDSALHFSGWVPQRDTQRVTELLEKFNCAYEFADPSEDETPPISLYNSRLIYPFNMVTEMYSLPEYGSLDPNPLFAFFFAMFFGIMYADIGYGLVLLAISIIAQKKFHLRKGTVSEQLFMLMGVCAFTTIFWGVLFGSFFGDVIGVFSESFLGHRVDLRPLAFNPLVGNGPLILLGICLGFGIVQILFGMSIKAYMMIRDGKHWDALMDVGSWWLVFAGIAVLALGHGSYVMIAGFLALVLTQGRRSKGFFGKLLGGLGSLYDITAYLSDVLSYSRLMALCMASGVIASVFNILGGLTGPIFFWPIFLIGHAFNMAINIIGTYVHGARLQYLEFFGKWYREGGKAFTPLRITTKYIDVIKNEQEEIIL